MAGVVRLLGRGGQLFAEKHLGWSRPTIRKGLKELESGKDIVDRFHERGRKRVEEKLPHLLEHIGEIVEPISQADPTFRSTRTYIPLTAKSIRDKLICDFGYTHQQLPCVRTISTKLTELNYHPQKVEKCRPLKKIPETDDIFEQVHAINKQADDTENVLRISLDTKAIVNIGAFSRGGKSRCPGKAHDHDFAPDDKLTPFGILLPGSGESHLWFSTSKVTADFMVDCIEEAWPKWKEKYSPQKLVINADNGPECSGVRTQWLKRLTQFANREGIEIQLAYYPPYHSKYNPIERFWGVLENHWRGELLESIEKTLGLARSMTFRAIKPIVKLSHKVYKSGVTLNKDESKELESMIQRHSGLEKWFITIK